MKSRLIKLISASVFVIFANALFAQQVEYSVAEANGDGRTEALAVAAALKACIAQVNGMSIASDTKLEVVEATLTVQGVDTSKARENLSNRIETATKGRVASYQMLSAPRTTDAGVEVRVSARIAKYKSVEQDTRRRLAFLPLRASQPGYVARGSVEVWQKDTGSAAAQQAATREGMIIPAATVSSQLIQALSQKIVSSRKFMVLDREYTDEIATEQKTISASPDSGDLSKLGAILGADYIIAGAIENFSVQNETVNAGGIAVDRQTGSAAVALRVLDVATGQIKFADTINTNVTIRRGVSSASMDLAEQIAAASASRIINAIYPVLAISFANGELVLNQGGDMVKVGDRYEIFSQSNALTDPRTGETLGKREQKCGVIEIIRSKPKTSDAKIIESTGDLAAFMQKNPLVCRPLKADPVQDPSLKKEIKDDKLW